ncbi:MAG: pyridoxal 5'-phosphate synthase glutaminase subunit PdxT [Candidatus Izemoplasmatales bacterium]|jgi:5'-phosphate synthase pdxT subunit
MQIGVFALQGAFIEHIRMLEKLGVKTYEIRNSKDLRDDFDGLVLPGGESTTMYKLLHDLKLEPWLKKQIKQGMPIFGTCAGLLLLAKEITNHKMNFLSTMNIVAIKNAYGKQLGSFRTVDKFNKKEVPLVFIRAPYIESVGEGVEILATVDGKIVAARDQYQLATAFHPELTSDLSIHEYFIDMIKNKSKH